MEEILGGILIGAAVTTLYPKLVRGVTAVVRPAVKFVVEEAYTMARGTMAAVSEVTEGAKDMWAEARAEAEAGHRKEKQLTHAHSANKAAKA